jgi:dipeptidyl aminopeptidase/acylaminoacyl peptidase
MGWSHGGYQTLMNIFKFPDAYQVAYAGVPVSDLVQRMGSTIRWNTAGVRRTSMPPS